MLGAGDAEQVDVAEHVDAAGDQVAEGAELVEFE